MDEQEFQNAKELLELDRKLRFVKGYVESMRGGEENLASLQNPTSIYEEIYDMLKTLEGSKYAGIYANAINSLKDITNKLEKVLRESNSIDCELIPSLAVVNSAESKTPQEQDGDFTDDIPF